MTITVESQARSLASKIREARIARDLTRIELAARLGVTRSSIGQWETGANQPTLHNICRISEITGLPVHWFIDPDASEGAQIDVTYITAILESLPPLVRKAFERELELAVEFSKSLPDWAQAIKLPLTETDLDAVLRKILIEMRAA